MTHRAPTLSRKSRLPSPALSPVTNDEPAGRLRRVGLDPPEEILTRDAAGHSQVGDDHVERSLAEVLDRLPSGGRPDDDGSQRFEDLLLQVHERGLVVDDQHRAVEGSLDGSVLGRASNLGALPGIARRDERQLDREACSSFGRVLGRDPATGAAESPRRRC